MRGMKLLAVFGLTVLIAACLVGTPAFSGEHPWDNDNQHPGTTGGSQNSGGDSGNATGNTCMSVAQSSGGRPGTMSSTSASVPVTVKLAFYIGNWIVDQFHYGKASVSAAHSKQMAQTQRKD